MKCSRAATRRERLRSALRKERAALRALPAHRP
jgi:hypothetical protein